MTVSTNIATKFSVNVIDLLMQRIQLLLGSAPCKSIFHKNNRLFIQLDSTISESQIMMLAAHLNKVILTSAEPHQQLKIVGKPEEILKALTGLKSINSPPTIYAKPSPLQQLFTAKR